MSVAMEPVSRRGAVKMGALGLVCAVASGLGAACPAFADEGAVPANPKTRIIVRKHDTGETIYERELPLSADCVASGESVPSLNRVAAEVSNGLILLDTEFVVPRSVGDAASRAVVDESQEDEFSGIKAKITLAVNWGANKSSIQIQKGTFSITQVNPLVIYSNAFYGVMQKEHYLSDMFNGKPLTVTTGWPSQPFNAEADQWTCGGAVGGLLTDLTNGEQQDFTVEIYF